MQINFYTNQRIRGGEGIECVNMVARETFRNRRENLPGIYTGPRHQCNLIFLCSLSDGGGNQCRNRGYRERWSKLATLLLSETISRKNFKGIPFFSYQAVLDHTWSDTHEPCWLLKNDSVHHITWNRNSRAIGKSGMPPGSSQALFSLHSLPK